MDKLTIITNNVPRPIICGYELPANARPDFDYLDAEEFDCRQFVKYKSQYYDIGEFMRVESEELKAWHGVAGQSYFSGVLVKIVDSDQVIMGRYYS